MSDFADLSSHNEPINLNAYAAAGHRTVVLKATESTDYTWPLFVSLAEQAHSLGLEVAAYHFGHQAGAAEAEHFLTVVGPLLPIISTLIYDYEEAAKAPPRAADGAAFMAAIEQARTGKALWVYASNWIGDTRLSHRDGWDLWRAAYGPSTVPASPAGWPAPVAWQFTSSARCTGVTGDTDLSHDYRTASTPAPTPVPQSSEEDMKDCYIKQDSKGRVWYVNVANATKLYIQTPALISTWQYLFALNGLADHGTVQTSPDPWLESLHTLPNGG